MKKVILLVVAMTLSITVLQAQTVQEKKVKSEIKSLDKKDPNQKNEKKTLRRELHKLKGQDVSNASKGQFMKDFGKISNVKWKRNDYFDQATFMKDGTSMTAFYDDDSKLVGTTTVKKFSDLPSKAQNDINKKYKDYTIGSVIYFKDNEFNEMDIIMYGREFSDSSYFVELSKNGKNSVLQVTSDGNVTYFEQMN